jgi:hypothetical protein
MPLLLLNLNAGTDRFTGTRELASSESGVFLSLLGGSLDGSPFDLLTPSFAVD